MKKNILAWAAVSGMMMFGLAGCGGTKMDLSDYVSVSFVGVDGNGRGLLDFDSAQFELDYAGVDGGMPTSKEIEKMLQLAPFEFSISCELDEDEGLSNGDKLEVSVDYNADLAKEAGIKIGSTTKKVVVEGLTAPIELDPFAETDFEVNGQKDYDANDGKRHVIWYADGDLDEFTVSMDGYSANPELANVMYTINDDGTYFSEGHRENETVTIVAELYERAKEQGYVLKNSEYTVTLDIIKKDAAAADLSAADFKVLNQAAKDVVEERLETGNFVNYEAEGVARGANKVDEVKMLNSYASVDAYGTRRIFVTGKAHVTEEYVVFVGEQAANREVYFGVVVEGAMKTKGEPIVVDYLYLDDDAELSEAELLARWEADGYSLRPLK